MQSARTMKGVAKGPLRKIVREYTRDDGIQLEDLECGHTVSRKQDLYGPTNAYRRRCWQCGRQAATAEQATREPTTDRVAELEAEITRLTGENARLRAACQHVIGDLAIVDDPDAYSAEYFADIVTALRLALAGRD